MLELILNFVVMKTTHFLFSGLLLISGLAMAQNNKPIYSSKAYTIYPDRVEQGKYTARAVSATQLTSDYRSPVNMFKSPVVEFKFSINGKDNEMTPGVNHQLLIFTEWLISGQIKE